MEVQFHSTLNFVLILVVGFTPLPLHLWRKNTTLTPKRRLSGSLSCLNFLKVKHFHYRPGQAQRVLRKLSFLDFVTTAQDGGKIVSLTDRPHLPPGNISGTHFCQRLSRTQGHSAIGRILFKKKNPLTPAAFEPATFRFVTQYLN